MNYIASNQLLMPSKKKSITHKNKMIKACVSSTGKDKVLVFLLKIINYFTKQY